MSRSNDTCPLAGGPVPKDGSSGKGASNKAAKTARRIKVVLPSGNTLRRAFSRRAFGLRSGFGHRMVCSPKVGPANMVVVAKAQGGSHGEATNEGADRARVAG